MKKVVLTALAVALSASAAFAADMKMVTKAPPPPPPPSPWDIAFGGAIMSDYIFRGITQSAHEPSVAAYFEPRYNINPNLQLYAGISGESIDFANRAAAEIDFYGGVRPTWGPVAFDFGFWYYWYPGGQCVNGLAFGVDCFLNSNFTGTLSNNGAILFNGVGGNVIKKDLSFWELYAKAAWTINDQWALGGNFYYTDSFLNSGAEGEYASVTLKYTAPGTAAIGGVIGWYVSGEFGYQWLGTSDAFYGVTPTPVFAAVPASYVFGIPYADYATWNIGVGLTWKVFTLDLRYWDTDLSKANCNAFTSDHTASFSASFSPINPNGVGSNWCDARFVAKLSFDMTLGVLK